ncbi:MAG: hypothetical protein Q4F21_15195 [Lachnospiraceae bacterium]|nr:hypothetical protein [Lachnospiraceae bacterium]
MVETDVIVKERKLNVFLFIVCGYLYFKIFWWAYRWLEHWMISAMSIQAANILGILVILWFAVWFVPATLGIRRLVRRFLES